MLMIIVVPFRPRVCARVHFHAHHGEVVLDIDVDVDTAGSSLLAEPMPLFSSETELVFVDCFNMLFTDL